MNKTLILQIFLVVVIVSGTSWLGYDLYTNKPAIVEEAEEEERNLQPPSDSIEAWQTYRNEELGFEFQYPSEWGRIKEIINCTNESPCKGAIRFYRFTDVDVTMGGLTEQFSYPSGGAYLGSSGYDQSRIDKFNELFPTRSATTLSYGNVDAMFVTDTMNQSELDYGRVYKFVVEVNISDGIVDGFGIAVHADEDSVTENQIKKLYKTIKIR